ncbi:MAG: hypothetical protein IPI35_24795 [Deltaproteobacteria bacterium]|nr:hypothetical protein [Deltaproteobacteria bacterium]
MSPWPFFIGADALALTTSWLTVELGAVEGDATTEPVPSRGWLAGLDLRLSAIQGAGSVTFYLSEDAAGLKLLTPSGTMGATQAINLALDETTAGGVSWNLGRKPIVGGALYAHFKLDAGTATGAVRVSGECGSAWRVRP